MAVFYEYQTILECDTCGEYVAEMLYQYQMTEKYRCEGWKIGRRVTCPACVERKQQHTKSTK